MRSVFVLLLAVLWLAAIPKVQADTAAACFVDREECYETCSYYEDDNQVAPCRKQCQTKYRCQALVNPNQIARTLDD